MIKSGKYKLARQIAGKGAFADVHLELEAASKFSIRFEGCDITEALPDGTPVYSVAVNFGVRFALEKLIFLRSYPGNHAVKVTRIHTMQVDSTEAFVAYCAARAFFVALGRERTNP